MKVTMAMRREDFVPEHPLFFKPRAEYYNTYTGPVRRAMQTLDNVELVSPTEPMHMFELIWHFPGRDIRQGVCYGDYPTLTGQYGGIKKYSLWNDCPIDLLMKTKWHPSRHLDSIPAPVFAGGFSLAVDSGKGDTDYFLHNILPFLRKKKDDLPQKDILLWNQFFFRDFGNFLPNRKAFRQHPSFHG